MHLLCYKLLDVHIQVANPIVKLWILKYHRQSSINSIFVGFIHECYFYLWRISWMLQYVIANWLKSSDIVASWRRICSKSFPSYKDFSGLRTAGMYLQGRPLRPRSHPNFEDDLDKFIYLKLETTTSYFVTFHILTNVWIYIPN